MLSCTHHYNIVFIRIGFEPTEYTIEESVGKVEVYVRVFEPPDEQFIPLTIDLTVQTIAGTAGKDRLF